MSRGTLLLVCSLSCVCLPACSGPERVAAADGSPEPRRVTTALVIEAPLRKAITVTGTLAAEDQVALSFKVAGRVADVRVDLGSAVDEGQVVATLVPTDFELRVRQAEAALVQARVRLGLPAEGETDVVDPENTALVRQRRAVTQEARLNRDRQKTFVERLISPKAEGKLTTPVRTTAAGN